MKKIKYILVGILVLTNTICFFAGCGSNDSTDKYTVKICGGAFNVPGTKYNVEYDKWLGDPYQDSWAEKEKTIEINGYVMRGTYQSSKTENGAYYAIHYYYCENDDMFCVKSDGEIAGAYFRANKPERGADKSLDTCIAIAENFANVCYPKIDLKKYTVSTEYRENIQGYIISFTKYIGDVKTMEDIAVSVRCDGYINSIHSTMLGEYSDDYVSDFDMNKVDVAVRKRMNDHYDVVRDNYDRIEYTDLEYMMTKVEKDRDVVYCKVEIKCWKGKHADSDMLELVCF